MRAGHQALCLLLFAVLVRLLVGLHPYSGERRAVMPGGVLGGRVGSPAAQRAAPHTKQAAVAAVLFGVGNRLVSAGRACDSPHGGGHQLRPTTRLPRAPPCRAGHAPALRRL